MLEGIKKALSNYKLLSIAAKATIAYTVASLFTKGLGIITTPLFTRLMTSAEIGEFNNFQAWYTIINVVATFSLSSGTFSVAMFEFPDDRDRYSSSVLGLSFVAAAFTSVIYFISPEFWNGCLSLSTPEMIIMLISFFFIPATDYRIVRLRYEYRYKQLISITLLNAVIGTALSIALVFISQNRGVDNLAPSRIFGSYGVQCAIGLTICVFLIAKGKVLYDKKYWKYAIISTSPLIVGALAKHVLELSDRTMITKIVGMSETGIYSTLYSVSALSTIVWTAIESSLLPYIFENLRQEREEKISKIIKPLLIVYALVCFGLTLIAPEIVRILATKEYYESIYIMPPVACGMFFTAIYNIFGDVLLYQKKTNCIMVSTIIASVANIGLNYIYIQRYGYLAASYTTLICYILMGLFQYLFMRHFYKRKVFDIKFIVLLSILLIIICMSCLALYNWPYIRYAIIVAMVICLIVWRKNIMSLFKLMRSKKTIEAE